MTTRIGIGISPDSVCAVLARGHDVEWSGIEIIDDQGLDGALTRVLSKLPRLSWPRPRVHAAVAAEHAHVKTIHALPLTRDARALGRIVAASPSRFFVVTPGTATVSGARVLDEGVVRVALVNDDVIAHIQDACAASGLTLARIVPSEIAMAALVDEDRLDPCALGIGAVFLDRGEPVVIRPPRWTLAPGAVGPGRIRAAASVAAIAVIATLTLPTLVAKGQTATAERETASIGPARTQALSAERGLAEVAQMLVAASEFEQGRISVTWLLGQLVHTLPANAAIVSLKVEGAAVTLNALASRATDVVRAIQDMPGASNVEMIGAITYEGAAVEPGVVSADARATGLERVTIRFRIAPDPADLRTALASDPEVKK